jgi:hypothetical protein
VEFLSLLQNAGGFIPQTQVLCQDSDDAAHGSRTRNPDRQLSRAVSTAFVLFPFPKSPRKPSGAAVVHWLMLIRNTKWNTRISVAGKVILSSCVHWLWLAGCRNFLLQNEYGLG